MKDKTIQEMIEENKSLKNQADIAMTMFESTNKKRIVDKDSEEYKVIRGLLKEEIERLGKNESFEMTIRDIEDPQPTKYRITHK